MRLIQALPDSPYFVWQLYAQMLNFRDWGIEQDAVIVVSTADRGEPSAKMKEFEEWTKAKVYYFNDTRESKEYASSIRPHLLAKYFEFIEQPEIFFYHDQDIIFVTRPELDSLMDGTCYVAPQPAIAPFDYLSTKYCKMFHNGNVFTDMCTFMNVSPDTIEENDVNAGGAQYVLSGIDANFWKKMEMDCEILYQFLYHTTREDASNSIYHIQIWTADMWCLLWSLFDKGYKVRQSNKIGFNWPWEPVTLPIMHNAGITEHNMDEKDQNGNFVAHKFFFKSGFNGEDFPFGRDFSFVSKSISQYFYVLLLNRLKNYKMPEQKRKVLGIYCTTNKIHPDLLALTLNNLQIAKDHCENAAFDVEIVTVSWEVIPNNPFKGYLTPFRNLGHLNYVLQLKQALVNEQADMVCILEHDVLYPKNYFTEIFNNWDYGKYGVCNNNYIGMNETGYLDVKERHQPFSLMSMSKAFLEDQLDQKVNECIKNIGDWDGRAVYGWCYVEPHDKSLFAHIPFTDQLPAIHVNMNHLGGYGTGQEGKNHHFTSHCEVCYDADSHGKLYREDWGDYKNYFTFK